MPLNWVPDKNYKHYILPANQDPIYILKILDCSYDIENGIVEFHISFSEQDKERLANIFDGEYGALEDRVVNVYLNSSAGAILCVITGCKKDILENMWYPGNYQSSGIKLRIRTYDLPKYSDYFNQLRKMDLPLGEKEMTEKVITRFDLLDI